MPAFYESNNMKIKLLAAALGLLLSSLLSTPSAAWAETGVTATEIKIGMANALTGPTAGLGLGIKSGSEAYFKKVNAAGGVNGRTASPKSACSTRKTPTARSARKACRCRCKNAK